MRSVRSGANREGQGDLCKGCAGGRAGRAGGIWGGSLHPTPERLEPGVPRPRKAQGMALGGGICQKWTGEGHSNDEGKLLQQRRPCSCTLTPSSGMHTAIPTSPDTVHPVC